MSVKKTTKLECPISYALDVVGDQWNMLIVRDLMIFGGVRRFDALCDSLEISRNILTERLRNLTDKEVVVKQPLVDGGRRMEYKLTKKGWELMPLMLMMLDWCLKWDQRDLHNYSFVDEKEGKPIQVGGVFSEDGRLLTKEDIRIVPLTDEARDYLNDYR